MKKNAQTGCHKLSVILGVAFLGFGLSPMLIADTTTPSGSISTDRKTVLADTVVNVDWSARYPRPILDIVDRSPEPGQTLTPRVPVRVDVRVIGAAFGPTTRPYPVRGWVKTSASSSWTQIFLGNNNTYNPQTIVWSKILQAGEKLDFRFQGSYARSYNLNNISSIGSWQPMIDTTPTSARPWNRKAFIDGEVTPNYNPAFDQDDVHAHLAAYFDPGTTRLRLGENDFIYLTELSPNAKGHKNTDMQDLVFLVTFTEITAQ